MSDHVPPEVLSALVDGELGPDERRAVHEHLRECDGCRSTAAELGTVRRFVGALPPLLAPEAFVADVLRRTRSPMWAVRRAMHGRRRLVAAALAAAAVGVSVAGLAVPPEQPEPPVDVYMARHTSVSAGNHVGGQVLFAVNNR